MSIETSHQVEMVDDYQSTDESDIDAFLEYAREKVAENNISYDSASFREFEDRLQNCIANHFLEGGDDSMASEVSSSGYINEGVTVESLSSNDSKIQYNISAIPRSRLLQGADKRNDSIQSDSSDSILDDTFPPQRRPRKPRRRMRKKKQPRGESENPKSAYKNKNVSTNLRRRSSSSRVSTSSTCSTSNKSNGSTSIRSTLIDTANLILPSLVKKGIIYFDIPKIERMLSRKSSKFCVMNRKHKVMEQLLQTQPIIQSVDHNVPLNGMALVRKLRAEREVALQAAFLKYSGEKQTALKEPSRTKIPIAENNESPKSLKSLRSEQEIIVQAAHLVQSPSSLSSFSSIEEKNRFESYTDTTQRNMSHSIDRYVQDSLRQKQSNYGEFCMSSLYSNPRHEAGIFPKASLPFAKIKFSRLKVSNQYAELSTSSLSNDSWFDSGDSSTQIRSFDSNYQDENPLHTSNDSEWSEMSFTSDPQRFTLLCSSKKSPMYSHREAAKLPPIPCSGSKAFDDSFDELVFRKQPDLSGNSFSNGAGFKSPTGVMDFGFKAPLQKRKKDSFNALAFVDEDEESHIFTDNKDDSFVQKSPGKEPSPICHPVFFTSNRFEI